MEILPSLPSDSHTSMDIISRGKSQTRPPAILEPQPMTTKRLKRPRDPIQLGKLIVDIATGQVKDEVEDKRNPAAVELGRKGGEARSARLSKKRRTEIAKKAAKSRWSS